MYQAVEWWGNIPQAMRDYSRFMVCGKDKAPLDARTGYRTQKNDPAQWLNFGDACYFAEENDWLLGYVPRPDCPFTIIDIDNKPDHPISTEDQRVRDDLLAWAVENTYVERSISGNGYHIVVQGKIPADLNKGLKRGIEAYGNMGFVVLTGNCVSKTNQIAPDGGLCQFLHDRYGNNHAQAIEGADDMSPVNNPTARDTELDNSLIATMSTWSNAAKIEALFYGRDLRPDGSGGSEGDVALLQAFLKYAPHDNKVAAAMRMFLNTPRAKLRYPAKSASSDWHQYLSRTLDAAKVFIANDAAREAAAPKIDPAMVAQFYQQAMERAEQRATIETNVAIAKATGQLLPNVAPPLLPPPNPFQFFTATELKQRPDLEWILKGIFPAQGIGAVWGESGSGKSFLVLDMMDAISTGSKWFGIRTKAKPVVCLALEGAGGLRQRVMGFEQANGRPYSESVRFFDGNFNLTDNKQLGDFCQALNNGHGHFEGLVVIDTMNQASNGADENSSRDMGQLIAGMKLIQQMTKSMVIVVHHATKSKDVAQSMRGHSSFQAACDGIIQVEKTIDDDELRKWSVTKSKDGSDTIAREFDLVNVQMGFDGDNDPRTSRAVKVKLVESIDRGTGLPIQEFAIPEPKNKAGANQRPKSNGTYSAGEYANAGNDRPRSAKQALEAEASNGSNQQAIKDAITMESLKTGGANVGKHGAPPGMHCAPRNDVLDAAVIIRNAADPKQSRKNLTSAINKMVETGKIGGQIGVKDSQWLWLKG